MAAHRKIDALHHLSTAGLVALYHAPDPGRAFSIADALCAGGVRAIELTNRGDHTPALFAALEPRLRKAHPDCLLGVGSIVDAGTASAFMNLGADFVVGPALVEEVAKVCNRRQVPYIPGCGTLTEMLRANELGCDIVKAFPAGPLGGPDFVRNVLAPCPWLQIMPTGGVSADADGLRAWFDAGVFAVGMGSNLVPTAAVDAGDWAQLTRLAAEATLTLASVR